MGLYKGTNQIKLYKGDYHPLALRVGNTQIAGYTTETATGTNAVELNNCYNEKLKAKVYGNSTQDTSVQSANVLDLTKQTFSFISSTLAISDIAQNAINIDSNNNSYAWVYARFGPLNLSGTNYNLSLKVDENSISNEENHSTISRNYGVAGIFRYDKGTFNNVNKSEMNLGKTEITRSIDITNVDTNLYDYYLVFYPTATSTGVTGTFKYKNIMLKEGTGVTKYVPFVPNSPSLDYPSEIISAGDLVTEGEHEGKYKITLQNEGLSTSELQTTTIYLDAPLRAIEVSNTDNYNITQIIDGVTHYYIADYVDFARQKVVRNIGEIVLNELLTYARYPTNITGQYRFKTNISNCYSTSSIVYYLGLISNKLKSICRQDGYACMEGISYLPETGYAGPGLMLYIDECKTLTVEEFKTYLSTNPITVDYILATPTEEDIELEDINVIPNYCKVSVEVEQEPLALEVEYAKMIN